MESLEPQTDQVPEIKFALDEFDLENYELSPLTQGLGFHHGEKKHPLPKPQLNKVKTLNPQTLKGKPLSVATDLKTFHNHRPIPKIETKKKKLKKAEEVDQLCAFFFDLIILMGSYLGMLAVFIWTAEVPFKWSVLKSLSYQFWPYLGLLWGMIFLFYFTLFDPSGTLGKRFMGLQLVNISDSRPTSLKQSFLRAFISLMSLALLGFPFLFSLPGRLSRTRLIVH